MSIDQVPDYLGPLHRPREAVVAAQDAVWDTEHDLVHVGCPAGDQDCLCALLDLDG